MTDTKVVLRLIKNLRSKKRSDYRKETYLAFMDAAAVLLEAMLKQRDEGA